MTSILTDHMLVWFLLFVAGLAVASCFGVNPLVRSDAACEQAVAGSPTQKAVSCIALMVAIVGEYAFFIGAIVLGVRYFVL